jgi:hypothetical protein
VQAFRPADGRGAKIATSAGDVESMSASRNLASISPFFIVKNLKASVAYYCDRLGFELNFQGPDQNKPYYAGVGFEISDADGYVLAFFTLRNGE